MHTPTDDEYDRILEAAEAEGERIGKALATWYEPPDDIATAARILAGIEDGVPEILDTLPRLDMSGQWADEPTPAERLTDILWLSLGDDEITLVPEEEQEILDTLQGEADMHAEIAVCAALVRVCEEAAE